jgi:putative transcriptional regulator
VRYTSVSRRFARFPLDWGCRCPIKASRPAIAALAQQAREATGLSQTAFAERYRIPLSTFRDREQGQRVPDAAAKNYLRLIAKMPEQVARALEDAA